jgi:hypothetical protein
VEQTIYFSILCFINNTYSIVHRGYVSIGRVRVNPISPNPNSPNLILFNPISLIPKRLIPISPNSNTLQYENRLFVLTFKASDVSSDKSFAGHRGDQWQEHSLVRCRFTADTKEGELSSSRSGNTASYANFRLRAPIGLYNTKSSHGYINSLGRD